LSLENPGLGPWRDRGVIVICGHRFYAACLKALLAIAAVVDVALRSSARPISAKALTVRQGLPPRHLEPLLQTLVRNDILIRGPQGGHEPA
jgi:hypothetical protein